MRATLQGDSPRAPKAKSPPCNSPGASRSNREMANGDAVIVCSRGTGDAFGSGGRFESCFLIRHGDSRILLECGTSSLTARRRVGEDPTAVDAVVVSHLHGDHFGGIPFLILDQHFAKRRCPLVLAGPPELRSRVWQAMEVLFPDSTAIPFKYSIDFTTLAEDSLTHVAGFDITAYCVMHSSGAPAFALRVSRAGRVIAYSGDTEWVPVLADVARNADLFICKAHTYETRLKYHLSYGEIHSQRSELSARRMVLTHPEPELLAHASQLSHDLARDGDEFYL
jgi:ribonuclease BN (tRNA processing enzyme)